jgi:hypothetical protein
MNFSPIVNIGVDLSNELGIPLSNLVPLELKLLLAGTQRFDFLLEFAIALELDLKGGVILPHKLVGELTINLMLGDLTVEYPQEHMRTFLLVAGEGVINRALNHLVEVEDQGLEKALFEESVELEGVHDANQLDLVLRGDPNLLNVGL